MLIRRWISVVCAVLLICGATLICGKDYQTLPTNSQPNRQRPTIIIDAGHGGIDSGASGKDGTPEKIINLSISYKVKEILTALGYKSVMTREADELLISGNETTIRQKKRNDLSARLDLVEKENACILLSIHQNYYDHAQYSGTQVFFARNHPDNQRLAQSIQSAVARLLQPTNRRSIKTVGSEIFLLNQCTKPAVMVECGFMSNTKELSLLKNEEYQTKMAFCIVMGLLSYDS
ncbi:MAG: N-acetylmuramoyl-L-alanine amidase [Clostridia bacterium]|nr:N-acetylmuramoyl-L-alanine amidase [Clostridia bacterium]